MKAKIIVHCLVENEGRFIWYAINSVLPYVDKIMVWDMSSTDGTKEILRSIESEKISFKQVGAATSPDDLTRVRQQMIKETPKDHTWLMILDGDEIWPESSIETVTNFARENPSYESIVVRTNNLVGDIYHRLPESAGRYNLSGHTGHLALRFMNLKQIGGLCVSRPHGTQGFFDSEDRLVQDRDAKKIKFLDLPYHHATHLPRSLAKIGDLLVPKRKQKLKHEVGEKITREEIPTVFFIRDHPSIVPDVTSPAPLSFWLKSFVLTPLRRLKRIIIKSPAGY